MPKRTWLGAGAVALSLLAPVFTNNTGSDWTVPVELQRFEVD